MKTAITLPIKSLFAGATEKLGISTDELCRVLRSR